jgi:uncharacterized protein (TIGR02058 family)
MGDTASGAAERPIQFGNFIRTRRRVTETGMGVDVHGLDYTAADAIHHSSLGFPRLVGKTADDMRVDVTIGVPKPEAVDRKDIESVTVGHA